MKEFKVLFALQDSEYYTALRLIAGAMCACKDVDIDAMEDFKLCVNEAALILKNSGYESVEVTFSIEGSVEARINGVGGNAQSTDNSYSLSMLGVLISSYELTENNGVIEGITLKL